MFGPLGFQELLFIFALALLIFGPKKLPQIGRTLGRGLAEFRKASNDLRRTINSEMIEQELRDSDPRRAVKDSLEDLKRGLYDEDPAEPARSQSAGAQKVVTPTETATTGAVASDREETEERAASEGAAGAAGTVARGSAPGTEPPDLESPRAKADAAEPAIANSRDDEPTP